MSDYFTASGDPADDSALDSSVVRAEFTNVATNGFAKIAGYTGAGSRVVFINTGATAQSTDSAFTYNSSTDVLTVNTSTFGLNTSIAGTLGITGALTYGGVALTAAVTGTGKMVLDTSPTLATPTLGVATVTSVNKVTITQPATGATLTIIDGKTLTVDKSLEFDGTDGTKMTFPSTSATIARTDAANTFTGTQTFSAGSGTGTLVPAGLLNVQTSAAGIGNGADATNDTLFTYTLPANSLNANGKAMRVKAWGTLAANGNSKLWKIWFAGVDLTEDVFGGVMNGLPWSMTALVVRIDATHVSTTIEVLLGSSMAGLSQYGAHVLTNQIVSDLTANTSVIKTTGQSGASAANDVLGYGMSVEFLN